MSTPVPPSRLDSTNDFSSLVPSAFDRANLAFAQANAGFAQANTNDGGSGADSWARGTANAGFITANSASIFANGSFIQANAAYNAANNASDAWVRTKANNAYDTANSASLYANGAFAAANTSANVYLTVALSDETTSITTGTAKVTFRAPHAMTLYQIPRASLATASTSGIPEIDINKNGTTIFGTRLTIDANEKTSVTAATPAVLSTTTFSDDDEITMDIDVAGTGAKGLKVTLYYRRT